MERFNSTEEKEATPLMIAKDIIYSDGLLNDKVEQIEKAIIEAAKSSKNSDLLGIGDVRLLLPDREKLQNDASDYADKLNIPQNDSQDWQEYEQAKMEYVLDLIYGKGNEA